MTGFDPRELTRESSLNHVVIGKAGVADVEGRLAQDVCSRDALHTLARSLGLTRLRPHQLADDLARALASPNPPTAQAAAAALQTYGRRLGALIATLRDPATAHRQAVTPARHAFLSHWPTVGSVWLAGGLLAHGCGQPVIDGVRMETASTQSSCHVGLAPYPALAPLIGAARLAYGDTGNEVIALADLGHTSVKTAIAERRAAALTRLQMIDTWPAPTGDVATAVTDALAATVRHAAYGGLGKVRFIVSVASFLVAGTPADDGQGIYGCLANRSEAIRDRISAATGIAVDLEFVHDGTAAASAADSPSSATITAGTWLGVGFQPSHRRPLLALSPDFRCIAEGRPRLLATDPLDTGAVP